MATFVIEKKKVSHNAKVYHSLVTYIIFAYISCVRFCNPCFSLGSGSLEIAVPQKWFRTTVQHWKLRIVFGFLLAVSIMYIISGFKPGSCERPCKNRFPLVLMNINSQRMMLNKLSEYSLIVLLLHYPVCNIFGI